MTEEEQLMNLLHKAKGVSGEEAQKKTALVESEAQILNVPDKLSHDVNEINDIKNKIIEIKKNINTIIDTVMDNPSMVTRAANAWGELPTWQKVGTGLVLTLPPILAGVAVNVAALLTLGGVTGVVYTTTGIILEDHHACSNDTKQKIQNGISSITGILEITIKALDNIRQHLQIELDKFRNENFRLAEHVSCLHDKISNLAKEIDKLADSNDKLLEQKALFEQQINELEQTGEQQKDLYAHTQNQLCKVKEQYQKTCGELSARMNELAHVRESMVCELRKTEQISQSLQQAVSCLSEQVIDEQDQREKLEAKINRILEKEKHLLASFHDTQLGLKHAEKDVGEKSDDNYKLLQQQKELITVTERLYLRAMKHSLSDFSQTHGVPVSAVKETLFHSKTQASDTSSFRLEGLSMVR